MSSGSIYLLQMPGSPFKGWVQFSTSVMSDSLWPHGLQHTRLRCPSPTPRVYPNSSPLSQWCHPTISSSVVSFSSCPQSFPASGSFQMSQFFSSVVQSIGVSASASVLPMNIQDWFLLGWVVFHSRYHNFFIHWCCFRSWLWWIMLQWTWVRYWLHFLWMYTQKKDNWIYFQVFDDPPCCFHNGCTLPPTVYKDSLFSTSSPTHVIFCLFDSSPPNKSEVISHCSFDLHFPDN